MRRELKSLNELVDGGVVQLTRGKIISKKDIAACPGDYPVYSSAKEGDGRFGEYGRYMFDEELITWSVDGGGRLFHRPKHRFSVTNVGGVLRILQPSHLDYKYLYHALTLRHSETTFDWVKKAHPSVIKKLYVDIPVPPLPEQKRIVGVLDETFAELSTAQANAEKNLQNARALFESHLQSVFTRRGKGWATKPLESVTRILNGYAFKSTDFSPKAPVKCIKITNVGVREFVAESDSYLPASFSKEYNSVAVRAGSVVIALTRTIIADGLKVAVVPREYDGALLNQRVAAIESDDTVLGSEYLFAYLSTKVVTDYVTQHVNTLMQPNLSIGDLRALPVPIPPPDEQKEVTAELNALANETQRLARIYEQKQASLTELKKSLLHQAFSGNL